MMRYPLKREILLLTDTCHYVCTISFAGKDAITAKNVRMRLYTPGELTETKDIEVAEEIIFERRKLLGYANIDSEKELEKIIEQSVTKKQKRPNLKLVKDNRNE